MYVRVRNLKRSICEERNIVYVDCSPLYSLRQKKGHEKTEEWLWLPILFMFDT